MCSRLSLESNSHNRNRLLSHFEKRQKKPKQRYNAPISKKDGNWVCDGALYFANLAKIFHPYDTPTTEYEHKEITI